MAMDLLTPILQRLNAAIDRHNEKVAEEEEMGNLTADEATTWRVPQGCVTKEMVLAGPQRLSDALKRALREIIVNESPDEIIRLADLVPLQTQTIKLLRIGSKRSIGMKEGLLRGMPVGVRLMDFAHLVAHAGASKVVLLG